MRRCPHCGEQLKTPDCVWYYADQYDSVTNVTTECCGKMIVITPVRTYSIKIYKGSLTEDDWGVPVRS
jgi:hypothetical protein